MFGVIAWLASVISTYWVELLVGAGVVFAAAGGIFVIRNVLRARAEAALAAAEQAQRELVEAERSARARVLADAGSAAHAGALEPAVAASLASVRARVPSLDMNDRRRLEALYRDAVASAVEDRIVTEGEAQHLRALEDSFGLPLARVREIRLEAFLQVFHAAIGDGRLTEEEDQSLGRVRAGLDIDIADLPDQLHLAEQLRRARQVLASSPAAIVSEIRLKPGELCFQVVEISELRKRAGAFVVQRQGRLHVTDRRILVVGDGTRSIPLESIFEVAVDPHEEILAVTSDERKTPFYFRNGEPFVLAAHIDRARAAVARTG